MIRVTTILKSNQEYKLQEEIINPEHLVRMYEDANVTADHRCGLIKNLDLDENHDFTKVILNNGHTGLSLTVVGSVDSIMQKIRGKQVLRG